MSKRGPTSQLNHDNWDAEDNDVEEAGHFSTAPKDELSKRVFRKAKRTMTSDSSAASPFAAFSGFKMAAGAKSPFLGISSSSNKKEESDSVSQEKSADAAKPGFLGFSFTSQKHDTSPKTKDNNSTNRPDLSGFSFVNNNKSDGNKEDKNSSAKTGFSFKTDSNTEILKGTLQLQGSTSNGSSSEQSSTEECEYSDGYYASLKSLNEHFLSWVQENLAKSKYCIFSPGFKDYETHLISLEKRFKVSKTKPAPVKPTSTSPTSTVGFSFVPASSTSMDKSPAKPTFSFSTGSEASSKPVSSLSGFSFADAAAKAAQSAAAGGQSQEQNEDNYSPPENEFKEVTEDEAFYSQKCKLFFKKSESFAEKGKGNLFLKKVDDKTQLIIRADTNLGNILLNIILNKSMPASRMGKNNVMIACVPNPPVETKQDSDKPIPMLIRVKTGEDADKLLEIIESSK